MEHVHNQVIIVGGGAVGLSTALMLHEKGLQVCLVGPPHRPAGDKDRRTAALFHGSIHALKAIGVWDQLEPVSAPLRCIRIIDGLGRLVRSPEVTFSARDAGEDLFGYNVPNHALADVLLGKIRADQTGSLSYVETEKVVEVSPSAGSVSVKTAEGETLTADLVIGADGRGSPCRQAAGIATRSWSYPQAAFVTSFDHSRPHNGISNEIHRNAGPLTTVPMPGNASSLVWVDRPDAAERLTSLSDDALKSELETHLDGLLGDIGPFGPRGMFPLRGITMDRLGARRIALVGEAAHVIPPIGAQGLNLGLRDGAHLADCLAAARAAQEDLGSDAVLNRYTKARSLDIGMRVGAVDVLNRSLLSSHILPVHLMRGLGLFVLKSFSNWRTTLVQQGLQPQQNVPSLMMPEGS